MIGFRFASLGRELSLVAWIGIAVASLSLACGGCPAASGDSVVSGQSVTDPPADGLPGADGVDGATGVDGAPGADGPPGADGVNGINGVDGADGAAGVQGIPGPIDTTQPVAVTSVLIRRSVNGAPEYGLAWEYIGSGLALSHFNIYVSSASITTGNKSAALWSSVSASERNAAVWIPPDAGQCFLRVAAVSYTGVEGALSEEKVVDPTSRVLYLADTTNDGSLELFGGTPAGTSPNNLSGPFATGQSIQASNIVPSPDGLRIAYVADVNADDVFELVVVDFATATRTKVNPTPVTGGDIWNFQWSPDGSRLAYSGDIETDDVVELWVVAATGGSPTKVSGSQVSTADVARYKWSPNGKQIGFTADRETDGLLELFVASAQGTTLTKVSGTRTAGHDVDHLNWSPDSARIAFSEYYSGSNMRMSVVGASGGTITNLSGDTLGLIWQYFGWAPDGRRLAYMADYDGSGVLRLFTVPALGGDHIDVSGTIVANGDVTWFLWSPNGEHLAFTGDKETDGVGELYVASPGGGGVVKVSGTLVANGNVGGFDFSWSPNSSRLLFYADALVDNVFELFTVGLDGAAPVKVSGTMVANGDVVSLSSSWSPDGTRILYRADQDSDDWFECYSVGFLGGETTKINTPVSGTIDVSYAGWATIGQ